MYLDPSLYINKPDFFGLFWFILVYWFIGLLVYVVFYLGVYLINSIGANLDLDDFVSLSVMVPLPAKVSREAG